MDSPLTEKTMADKLQFFKNILNRYSIGEYLKGQDFDDVFFLLKKHPNAERKIGVGIKDLLVLDSYGNKCFCVIKHDNTKDNFSYKKCLGYKKKPQKLDKPVKQEKSGTPGIIIESKPKPKKSKSSSSNDGVVKATSQSVKTTLVLDPASITGINSIGKKQVPIRITIGNIVLEARLNSKTYRKALTAINELGVENCTAILQGSMKSKWKIEYAGLAVQPKKAQFFELKKDPAFEKNKAFLNSKIADHSKPLEKHCGTNRAYNKFMSLDPNMTVSFLVENYSNSSLLKLKGFGRKCINGVNAWIYENNFKLGQKINAGYLNDT